MRYVSYLCLILSVLGFIGPTSTAMAGSQAFCDRLRTELATLRSSITNNPASETQTNLKKAEEERYEVINYSKSVGCDESGVLSSSTRAPAQCEKLKEQVKRLGETMSKFLDEVGRESGNKELVGRIAIIKDAYDLSCTGTNEAQSAIGNVSSMDTKNTSRSAVQSNLIRSDSDFGKLAPFELAPSSDITAPKKHVRLQPVKPVLRQVVEKPATKGFFESLFGPSSDNISEPELSEDGLGDSAIEASGLSRTICVRTCDGFYFPISSYISDRRMQLDQMICQASCPKAETSLYLQRFNSDVGTATSIDDGSLYAVLPSAFKYRTTIDQSCTCRAVDETWAETLMDAEHILRLNGQTDTQISELKAQQLSRPKNIKTSIKDKKIDPIHPMFHSENQPDRQQLPPDFIIPNTVPAGTTIISIDQGERREIIAPDGMKKIVRILPPSNVLPEDNPLAPVQIIPSTYVFKK